MSRSRGIYVESPESPLPHTEYDYAIVGAGVYGLPLGYFLRRLVPDARVVVLEDNTIPGEGITINTGGIIRACYSNPDVMRAAAFGQPYFAEPTKTMELSTSVHTGFVPATWGRFVSERHTPGIASELDEIVDRARELGIPGIWSADIETYLGKLEPQRRANLAKVIHGGDVSHVLVDDRGGYADGGSALLAFFEAALEYGVDVVRLCHVTGFVREGGTVRGVQYQRWRSRHLPDGSTEREVVGTGEITASNVIVAAGAGSRRLIERHCNVRMPTFPTYHQTPMVQNTADVDFASTTYTRETLVDDGRIERSGVSVADLPVISHWRDLYFHPETHGLVVGAHHRELHDEDYEPTGGQIGDGSDAMKVGLSQVLVDKVVDNMEHFPVLESGGLRLGVKPSDVPGGFYVMNPEELPFEGPVPGTGDGLFYIGSGSGTGFKLGPGLSYLLAQRLTGVPREQRLVPSDTLSVERNTYFFPAETTEAELRALFEPGGGRFRSVGASGIGSGSTHA